MPGPTPRRIELSAPERSRLAKTANDCGQKAADRLAERFPNAVMVHTPVHASWLNQAEVFYSIVQRKVLTPNDFTDLADIAARLEAFQDRYNFTAKPFNWNFTTKDLDRFLERLAAHEAKPTPAPG
jgi:hypothetical protein